MQQGYSKFVIGFAFVSRCDNVVVVVKSSEALVRKLVGWSSRRAFYALGMGLILA